MPLSRRFCLHGFHAVTHLAIGFQTGSRHSIHTDAHLSSRICRRNRHKRQSDGDQGRNDGAQAMQGVRSFRRLSNVYQTCETVNSRVDELVDRLGYHVNLALFVPGFPQLGAPV